MNKNDNDNTNDSANDNDDWDFHRPLNVLDIFKSSTKNPNNAQTENEEMIGERPIQSRASHL